MMVLARGPGCPGPLAVRCHGDLCYANLNPAAQPAVWADFGKDSQVSEARFAACLILFAICSGTVTGIM
jgi:hypothetical protein